jgi:signal transduction histidine kinase
MSQSEKQIIEQLKQLLENDSANYKAISKLTNELSKKDKNFQRFYIDAKTLIHLGRESIKDHTTALMELVKNSYDADSNDVEVEILTSQEHNRIRISDNGFGMTKDQLLDSWLRIGYSEKRISKVSVLGRRKTGEKGIGRISADRLGAKLELISKTENGNIVGLKVNWDDFDVDGKDLSEIDVELIEPKNISIPDKLGEPAKSGTEIIITKLRQPWSAKNIEMLYNEFSTITPPFNQISDFSIKLKNDVAPDFSRQVSSKYYEAAEIDLSVVFDGTDEVYYSIKDKYSNEELVKTINLKQFYSKKELNCGPVQVRLLFFLRESSSVVGTDFKLSDLREFLDNNYGVKIYRDNIVVKPYGFPNAQLGFDWLKLGEEKAKNPAGIGRGEEYTVSPNQLVGAIFITRDNNELLKDSAAREGLVENEGFEDMKEFVLAAKRLLEAHRFSIYPKIEKAKEKNQKAPSHKEVEKINEKLNSVSDDLKNIKNEIESKDEQVKPLSFLKPINRSIDIVEEISEEVKTTISDFLNWQRVLNGLATIGISSAVFGHETEGSITQFQGSTTTALKLLRLTTPNVEKAQVELEKASKASKKVAAWGAYALTRVQKERRNKRNTKIYKTLDAVAKELRPAFEASSITLSIKGENIISKTYQMDIETILVNLLTNAYSATLLKGGERKVIINCDREILNGVSGYYFSVSDTGPGIADEFKNRVFDPLFSTKTTGVNSKSVGTGLGLTIVKSIVGELEGTVNFTTDTDLGGAKFKVWLPKH